MSGESSIGMSDPVHKDTSGGGGAPPPPQQGSGNGADQSSTLHVLFNLVLLAGFAFLFHTAGDLPSSRWEPLGSGTFPRMVLGLLMLLNLLVIVTNLSSAWAETRQQGHAYGQMVVAAVRSSVLVIATFGLFGLFVLSIRPLGFVVSAFLFVLILQIVLGKLTTRNLVQAAIVAAVTAFGVNYLFDAYFNVFLPAGQLWR